MTMHKKRKKTTKRRKKPSQKKKKKFIQKAIKRPGRLREMAKREGAITKDGKISTVWLRKKKAEAQRRGDTSLVAAINLALRFKSGDLSKKSRKRRK